MDEGGEPVADLDDIRGKLGQGDVLVIIASDEVDPRVSKLSRTLLAKNVNKQWDLALVDVALYRSKGEPAGTHMIVPTMRGLVESDARQVVRVIVQGENPKATVQFEQVSIGDETPSRQRWDEKLYFESLDSLGASTQVQTLARVAGTRRAVPRVCDIQLGHGQERRWFSNVMVEDSSR